MGNNPVPVGVRIFVGPFERVAAQVEYLWGPKHITSAGSGTLVTVGSVDGILTAAHVIEALPKRGKVGIITSVDESSRLEAFKIEMDHAVPVVVGERRSIELGPDLAFLRLPPESVGWLTAKNSFYNLRKYRDDMLANKAPGPDHADTMAGVIDELTADAPGSKLAAKKTLFTTIFCGARLVALRGNMEHAEFVAPFSRSSIRWHVDWGHLQYRL